MENTLLSDRPLCDQYFYGFLARANDFLEETQTNFEDKKSTITAKYKMQSTSETYYENTIGLGSDMKEDALHIENIGEMLEDVDENLSTLFKVGVVSND